MKEVMRMEDRNLFKAKRLDNKEWVEGALVYDNKDELYRMLERVDKLDKSPYKDDSSLAILEYGYKLLR